MVDFPGDPQGQFARSSATEQKHPTRPDDPPVSYRRKQLLALALIVALPALAYVLSRWL